MLSARQLLAPAVWAKFLRHSHSGATGMGAEIPGSQPIGSIIMWDRPAADIPAGWVLCNGSSAIDLRAKFIMGAGGAHAALAVGGASSVNAAHDHAGSFGIASDGGHVHALTYGGDSVVQSDCKSAGFVTDHNLCLVSPTHAGSDTASGGAHDHALSGTLAQAGPTGLSTHPAHRKFYFIKRVS